MHHISPCPLLTLSGLFTSPAMVGVFLQSMLVFKEWLVYM